MLTRDEGRFSMFARGVRGPKARLAAVLQPFRLVAALLERARRGAVPHRRRECREMPRTAGRRCLLSGFYLNELVLQLTTRHDPQPALFDAYHRRCSA